MDVLNCEFIKLDGDCAHAKIRRDNCLCLL